MPGLELTYFLDGTDFETEKAETEVEAKSETEKVETEVEGKSETEKVETEVEGKSETEKIDSEVEGKSETEKADSEVEGKSETEKAETEVEGKSETEKVETEKENPEGEGNQKDSDNKNSSKAVKANAGVDTDNARNSSTEPRGFEGENQKDFDPENESEEKNEDESSQARDGGADSIVVSFISFAYGIDVALQKRFEALLAEFPEISFQAKPWPGAEEGEIDYLLDLGDLTPTQAKDFRSQLDSLLKDSELVILRQPPAPVNRHLNSRKDSDSELEKIDDTQDGELASKIENFLAEPELTDAELDAQIQSFLAEDGDGFEEFPSQLAARGDNSDKEASEKKTLIESQAIDNGELSASQNTTFLVPQESDNGNGADKDFNPQNSENGADDNVLSPLNSILPSAGNLISELSYEDEIESIGELSGVLNNLGGILSNLDAPIEAIQYLNTISNLLSKVDELPELLSNIDGPSDISNLFNQVGSLLGNITGTEEVVNYLSSISNIIGQIDGLVNLFDEIDSPQDALNAISGLLGTGGGIAREVVGLLGGDDFEIDDDSDDDDDFEVDDDSDSDDSDDDLGDDFEIDEDNDNDNGDDDFELGSEGWLYGEGETLAPESALDLEDSLDEGNLSIFSEENKEDLDNPRTQADDIEEGDFELDPEDLFDEEGETLDPESAIDLEDSLDEGDLGISTDENFEQDSDNSFSQTDDIEEGDFELGPEGLLDFESEFSREDVEEFDDLLEEDSNFGFLGENDSEELEEVLQNGAEDDDDDNEGDEGDLLEDPKIPTEIASTILAGNPFEPDRPMPLEDGSYQRLPPGTGTGSGAIPVQFIREVTSLGLDISPVVGDIKGVIEAFTGYNFVTRTSLAPWERALGAIPLAGGILKQVGNTGELLVKLGDNAYRVVRGPIDKLEELIQNTPGLRELLGDAKEYITPEGIKYQTSDDDFFKPYFEAIWSSKSNQTSVQNALGHWQKHQSEFPNIQNATQYVQATRNFLNNPPSGALVKIRANGEKVVYDPATGIFAVSTPTGEPKTMFKPDPAKHGYPTNIDYFNAQ